MKHKLRRYILPFLYILLALFALFPCAYMALNSFLAPDEVLNYYHNVNSIGFHLLPDVFSLEAWQALFRQTFLIRKFFYSLFLCVGITAGQLVVSFLGGFAFSKFRFYGSRILFVMLIFLALLPVQVTLVPTYLILERLHLLDTQWALVLPLVFQPLGTVFMTLQFRKIPNELLDAARVDGAGTLRLLWSILLPLGKGGTVCVLLFTYLDAWNMVEQPMTFLHDVQSWPLSVFFATATEDLFPLAFACGILALLPGLALFIKTNKVLCEERSDY